MVSPEFASDDRRKQLVDIGCSILALEEDVRFLELLLG